MKHYVVYYYGWYYQPRKIRIGAKNKKEARKFFEELGIRYEKINMIKEAKEAEKIERRK